jgi:hypothetical protein
MSAWRVTFAYDGDRVRVIGRQRIDTVSPPDDSDVISDRSAGFWVEVRDEHQESLYRQVIANPLNDQPEVYSPDPSEALARVEASRPAAVFQVLVPDHPSGHDIVLHGRLSSSEVTERASRQLVRAVLREQEFAVEDLP